MNSIEVMKQALEAMEEYQGGDRTEFFGAMATLRAAIEEAENNPERSWQGLTVEEIVIAKSKSDGDSFMLALQVQEKLKEKNHG